MRVGSGLGLSQGETRRLPDEAETTALVARFTTPPTATRKSKINVLIRSLKTAGVWAKLDCLYIMAAADAQAAQRNWIADTFNLSPVNAPTFTADRGYAGNGTSSYLSTGFIPATGGSKYLRDSAHAGSWSRTAVNATTFDVGATNLFLCSRSSGGTMSTRLNDGVSMATAVPTSIGHSLISRNAAPGYDQYKNGALLAAVVQASSGLGGAEIQIGAVNASAFSTRQIAAVHFGGGLTAGEVASCYAAIRTYLQGVGAA